ncbi:hypothetical protein ESB00_14520 [Oleiharenicola lentus]|uniref:Uncharacterized protein n=1 Tax=Oleiharenicola lentus TaxID=2508720 RepID=A0A4Q1C3T0_9BACT|nr:hypothetical protein [Oleiharenicola lentus]RXK52923.1 hypothetical protein ESB00_14520 [Oleiharenicola lentus]
MDFAWNEMKVEEFAAFVGLLGPRPIRCGEIYWGEVRRYFYRPLQPLHIFDRAKICRPIGAAWGGAQYAVSEGPDANSWLNWLAFDQTQNYSVATLDKNRRRQVRLAAADFEIRRLTDPELFKREAHPVYLSFQNRTGYRVGSERRDPAAFARWADQVFASPNVLVLGGYREGVLGGVSLTYKFGHTVFYATFFCDDESLRRYLSDLMLHTVRESAAADPAVRYVYAGMFKGIRGLDDFYLHRGARLFRQPARLELNPITRFLLKSFLPAQYNRLTGHLTPEQLAQAGVPTAPGP